jgi:hypothetical protein
MKINPVGVETYRQAMGKPQVENKPMPENKTGINEAKVKIPGQTDNAGSKLSVKLKPGAFVDMLSTEEKQALELLFAKYSSIKHGDYSRTGGTDETCLGNLVDVKL